MFSIYLNSDRGARIGQVDRNFFWNFLDIAFNTVILRKKTFGSRSCNDRKSLQESIYGHEQLSNVSISLPCNLLLLCDPYIPCLRRQACEEIKRTENTECTEKAQNNPFDNTTSVYSSVIRVFV